MENIRQCVYCGKPIVKESKEHIIQNAIGGLEVSTDICCPGCNELISRIIDVPFVKIFTPIVARIDNFAKTNNGKSTPSYKGKAKYNGKIYSVTLKNRKIVACPELSQELKCDISKIKLDIIGFDFNIENKTFLPGLSKIAFNYAISKGIPLEKLQEGLEIRWKDDVIESINFKYKVIPFVALNPMDKYLELETDFQLYHNIMLFSQGENLWCYVDLFNTFQYYVLLTDKWDSNSPISEIYFQNLQKPDRTVPEIVRWRPKYGLIYSQLYGVKPSPDKDIMQKRIEEAIKKESLKKEMSAEISKKLGTDYVLKLAQNNILEEDKELYRLSFQLYFDEESCLIEDTFRKVTLVSMDRDISSYPLFIELLMHTKDIDVKKYTFAKFNRLNHFLNTSDSGVKNSND